MFKHILVPLDGSKQAEEALPIAARIARATSGSLLLMQVVNTPIDYSGGMALVPVLSEQFIDAQMDEATAYLKTIAKQMLAGIETTTEVLFGIPALCILATAAERQVDLIVLCSHGRTGFTRWALGSVAHTLAHESMVPTLVLRESEPASRLPDTTRPLCALVPLDGSELAETALAPAAQLVAALAAPAPCTLQLAQVVQPLQKAARSGEDIARNDEASLGASTYLTHMAERLQATTKPLRLSVTWSVIREHDVASALVNVAEQGAEHMDKCDLIAISTHGRNGLERWVMGSVTDRLLNTTKLPILIVRPPKSA